MVKRGGVCFKGAYATKKLALVLSSVHVQVSPLSPPHLQREGAYRSKFLNKHFFSS